LWAGLCLALIVIGSVLLLVWWWKVRLLKERHVPFQEFNRSV
jgi:hypothetical protein